MFTFVLQSGPSIDFLGSFFWQFLTFIVAIVGVIGFLVYRYYIEPPLARWATKAKWSRWGIAFIQDDSGVVHPVCNNSELPEGVVHNKRGWFLKCRRPNLAATTKPGPKTEEEKRELERIQQLEAYTKLLNSPDISKKERELYKKKIEELTPELTEDQSEVLDTVLHAPILEGLGKAVFFGYDGAPLLGNLKTMAAVTNKAVSISSQENHKKNVIERITAWADLRIFKELIPATIGRTQIAALNQYSESKGYLRRGGDTMKFLFICVGGAVVIGSLAVAAFLLLSL